MEFSSHSTAIDFSHYSDFPDEYGATTYLESSHFTEDHEDEDDDGFSSSRLDIQEELLRGADYNEQLERGDEVENEEEEESEYGMDEAYWQSGSSEPSSYSTSSSVTSVSRSNNSSQAVKRSYSDESDCESSVDDKSEDDGGRRTKRARMEGEGKEWRKQLKPAYLLAASTEMLRIRFPFQSLSVRLADFLCLQEGELLNDTIIDFYLNHIVEHLLPDESDRRVTVLPSVFWHNLSLRQTSLADEVESMTDEEKERAQFEDILDFVADFDLIDVDFVVVPVNEWEHWSLVVVCHPFTPHARIVCFDSQVSVDPNDLNAAARLIAQFFDFAYSQRRLCPSPLPPIEHLAPINVVQQENHYDCGLYMLEYARRFLLQPPNKVTNDFDFAKEYADFTVEGKRTEMQRVILSLCANRSIWEKLILMLEAPKRNH